MNKKLNLKIKKNNRKKITARKHSHVAKPRERSLCQSPLGARRVGNHHAAPTMSSHTPLRKDASSWAKNDGSHTTTNMSGAEIFLATSLLIFHCWLLWFKSIINQSDQSDWNPAMTWAFFLPPFSHPSVFCQLPILVVISWSRGISPDIGIKFGQSAKTHLRFVSRRLSLRRKFLCRRILLLGRRGLLLPFLLVFALASPLGLLLLFAAAATAGVGHRLQFPQLVF